jgi:nigerose phosphorylase
VDWKAASEGAPSPVTIDELGSRYLSANGSIGLRGTLDEYGAAEKAAIIVNGLYDKVGALWREPVNAPNGCHFSLSCDGEALSARSSVLREHRQTLDFRSSIQGRDTVFEASSGALLRLSSSRFVSLASSRLICAEYLVEADRAADIELRTGIDAEVWDINGPHLRDVAASEEGGILLVSARTEERSVRLLVAETTLAEGGLEGAALTRLGPSGAFRLYSFRAEAGRRYLFRKYLVVADDAIAGGLPCSEALEACRSAAARGYAALRDLQAEAWEGRWAAADIEIEGDEAAAFALRFSIYHLLAIAPPAHSALSIPARGLSGQVYKGAVFWDTEIFMLPLFLNASPEVARALVEYRIAGLPGARRKAAEYGYAGAFFAWESQEGGEDACTLYNVNDVIKKRPIRTFFRDGQMHISADVAYALWRYFRATGDRSILLEGGAELMYECARFIVSWLYYKPGKDRYEVLDVTGPDEYHERAHNDYYTNAICSYALRACLEMDALLAAEEPEARSRVLASLGLEREIEELPAIARRLYVPKPDAATLVIPQFDGYGALEDVALPELLARKLHPNEYLGGGDGLARWTKIIKQADVVLALALLSGVEGEAGRVARANWDYYEPRTEHGSSLSASAYSLLAGRLGMADEAYAYFMKTATADLAGESKQYVGDLYIGGTHPAANGGAWLALYGGILGIEAEGDELRISPALPRAWTSVSLIVSCGRGSRRRRIRARVSALSLRLEALGLAPGGKFEAALEVAAFGKSLAWDGAAPLEINA